MEGLNANGRGRWRLEHVAETGSTNADLLAAAASGAPDGSVLVADHQTAGRGRLDRIWAAPAGANLLVSILFRDDLYPLQRLTQRVSLAALVACERVGGVSPSLKWPNDLLLDDRKLAGILAEAAGDHGRIDVVVVGLGLNIGWSPEGATRLPAGSRDEVLEAFLDALADQPADVAAMYRARLGTIGQMVRIEMPGEVLIGTAIDVDADGALIVDCPTGARAVSVGDVTHLRPL